MALKRPPYRILIALFSQVLFTGLVGCKKSAEISHLDLSIQINSEPVTLDPSLVEDGNAFKILGNTMDGLMGYDGHGQLVKRLAASFEVSKDSKTIRFKIRNDATWSDGVPVKPEDFVYGIRRSLQASTGSKLAPLLFAIRGAKDFHLNKTTDLGVSVKNGELVFELEKPCSYFLAALTLPITLPQRPGTWTDQSPVTGPYRITSREQDQKIVLTRNSWARPSAPSQVIVRIVQSESTAALLFEQGKIDILTRVSAFELKKLKELGVIRVDPYATTYYLSFNLRKAPFRDPRYRRAVAGAVQRQELAQLLGSGEPPARSWIPVGLEGYIPFEDRSTYYRQDVEEVRKILSDKTIAPITAAFDTSGRNAMIMEKVQNDLAVKLGLKLSLQNSDWKAFAKSLTTDPPELYRSGILAPFKDPIFHFKALTTGSGFNFSGWSNARYDQLVSQIEETPSGPKRLALMIEAQKILDEEVPVVPLYHYVQTLAVSPRVQNYQINFAGVIRFEDLGVK